MALVSTLQAQDFESISLEQYIEALKEIGIKQINWTVKSFKKSGRHYIGGTDKDGKFISIPVGGSIEVGTTINKASEDVRVKKSKIFVPDTTKVDKDGEHPMMWNGEYFYTIFKSGEFDTSGVFEDL